MADAIAAGSALRLDLSTVGGHTTGPGGGGDRGQVAAVPGTWLPSDDSDDDVNDEDGYPYGDDDVAAWEYADDAGQSLAGLALPVFDAVVADDAGDFGGPLL